MRIFNTGDALHTMIADHKGAQATINLTNGHTVEGTLFSINSNGLNVKDANGKTVGRALSKVESVDLAIDSVTELADEAAAIAELDPQPSDEDMDEDTEANYIVDMYESGEVDLTDGEGPLGDAHTDLNVLTDLPKGTDPFDTNATDALVAELDGCTTAELAEVFGIAAKELRVTLRALGMGVGKGHRYHLTSDQVSLVKGALNA